MNQISTKAFESYLARHLEELALFALPRPAIYDCDYGYYGTDMSSNRNSNVTTAPSSNGELSKAESQAGSSQKPFDEDTEASDAPG